MMTVKQLKELLATWSEKDIYGEDTEVWVGVENGGSLPISYACPLNLRQDDKGVLKADISLETEWCEEDITVEDMKLETYRRLENAK